MKIIAIASQDFEAKQKFEAEQKDSFLYVGRIRAAGRLWVPESGGIELEHIAQQLQGEILVHQTLNADDWAWAGNYLSGKIGNDTIYVAAAELYRDSTKPRSAQFISEEIMRQIEPQLESVGYIDECTDEFGDTKSALLNTATKRGADYVILEGCHTENWSSAVSCIFQVATGTGYKIKQNTPMLKSGIEINTSSRQEYLVPEPSARDSQALDYATMLLNGNAGGTVLD